MNDPCGLNLCGTGVDLDHNEDFSFDESSAVTGGTGGTGTVGTATVNNDDRTADDDGGATKVGDDDGPVSNSSADRAAPITMTAPTLADAEAVATAAEGTRTPTPTQTPLASFMPSAFNPATSGRTTGTHSQPEDVTSVSSENASNEDTQKGAAQEDDRQFFPIPLGGGGGGADGTDEGSTDKPFTKVRRGSAYANGMNPFQARRADDDEAASICDASEEDLREDLIIPVPDERGNIAHYPGGSDDSVSFSKESAKDARNAEVSRSVLQGGIESIKYMYSTLLLIFCVTIVMATIFTKQTGATGDMGVPPIVAFFIFWFLISWLAMMEGGQGALVGLQPVEKALYSHTHPRALKCTNLAHRGDNMERFIVGRQFLVVLTVFVTNLMASAVADARVLGLNELMTEIFLGSGVALILTTIMLGQLAAQVNAANCMLDFINNYFMLFTVFVSLAIEYSGLLHCVYLVQRFFSKITGKPIESNEPPRNAVQNIFFWTRVLMSTAILVFAFVVTLTALFNGQTNMWDGVPPYVSVIIFFVLMCFVGMTEGMQIALFAVVNLPDEELRNHPTAHKNCELTFRGRNLQKFLIGRQICVTICMFVVARIATVNVDTDSNEKTVLGVGNGFQGFFNTGLLGAIITTVVASLAWRIVASSFPVAFLSNPLIFFIIRLCLLIEKSGLCSASWVLARFHKYIANFQRDTVYLEGAEPSVVEPITRRDKDINRLFTVTKFLASLGLLVFAILLVMSAIFSEKTTGTGEMGIPTIAAFFIFWFLIALLAMMEGGQGALLGLQSVNRDRYARSHPVTYMNTNIVHKGNNMDRFIVGRQFLVVLVIFVTSLLTSVIDDANVLGLPDIIGEVFLATSLAVILVTIIIGQLAAQVNAANCMLDFVNNFFMLFITYVSLFVEMCGFLHSVYLVQIIFAKLTGHPIESKEPPRNVFQSIFFWMRVIFSLWVLGFALAVTMSALFNNQTAVWEGVPKWVSVLIFFGLMCLVGLMEGMQIALFAVVDLPESELKQHSIAYANCQLAFRGQNLQAFLIGRQILVTCCMFVFARITTIDVDTDASEGTVLGVGRGLQEFFNTGFFGAVITTIVASLAWRIVASSFPIAFLSNPLIYLIIRICLILEASGICSAAWVLGRINKQIIGYQPDEVYLEGGTRHTKAPVTRRDKDIDVTVTVIKYSYSTVLLYFSVIFVLAGIFSQQTNLADKVHPALAFFIMLFLIIWLAMMEGGQGCLVGLQPIDKSLYTSSHPVSHRCTTLAHKGDNMQRFILGRQFLVVLVVFAANLCSSAIADVRVLGLSDLMSEIFFVNGVAIIVVTIILGQLTAQVNAANCMLDFINTYFMLFTIYVSLAIEASGLLHAVYLVQIIFSTITGKNLRSNEHRRGCCRKLFFWARVLFSVAILVFSFYVTIAALFDEKTGMYDGVKPYVSLIILLVLMCLVGMMEGMQIALFSVVNLPTEEVEQYPLVYKICELTFTGQNLQAFLIGRQICVTICMFIIARITTIDVDVDEGESTVLGVERGVQELFNTGIFGAIITTIVASLCWRVIAASFPISFLSNPLIYMIVQICMILNVSGIFSSAWLLALIHKQIAGFQRDEVYIGARGLADTNHGSSSQEKAREDRESNA